LYFKIRSLVLFILCTFFLSACGYRFAGSGNFPAGVESIYIEVFENRSSQIGIERIVTSQVLFEFTRQRERSLTSSPDKADAILKGVIVRINTQTISRIGTAIANEREVTMTVDLRLIKQSGEVIWAAKGLSDRQAYDVEVDKIETDENLDVAIAVLSERMSERIFSRLTDDF